MGLWAGRLHLSDVFILPVRQEVQFILFLASNVWYMEVQSLIIGVLWVQKGTSSLRIMARLDFINE